jgi:large subunit ribosomal protein L32e
MSESLLKARSVAKARKPTYRRVQAHQFAKLNHETKWRKPKGMGNKVRRGRRGKPSMPEVGFKSPFSVSGLDHNGLRPVIVNNVADLVKVTPKTDVVVIGATVGGRKSIDILNASAKAGLKVSGHNDVAASVKSLTKISIKKAAPVKKAAPKKTEKTEEVKSE